MTTSYYRSQFNCTAPTQGAYQVLHLI